MAESNELYEFFYDAMARFAGDSGDLHSMPWLSDHHGSSISIGPRRTYFLCLRHLIEKLRFVRPEAGCEIVFTRWFI
jgi:hypothetical protein